MRRKHLNVHVTLLFRQLSEYNTVLFPLTLKLIYVLIMILFLKRRNPGPRMHTWGKCRECMTNRSMGIWYGRQYWPIRGQEFLLTLVHYSEHRWHTYWYIERESKTRNFLLCNFFFTLKGKTTEIWSVCSFLVKKCSSVIQMFLSIF